MSRAQQILEQIELDERKRRRMRKIDTHEDPTVRTYKSGSKEKKGTPIITQTMAKKGAYLSTKHDYDPKTSLRLPTAWKSLKRGNKE
jgi:hypothetical protein